MSAKDPVGRTYGPVEFPIRDEEVEAYLEATDDENPTYETPNSPVPPMFASVYARDVLGEVLFDRDLDLDLPRLVHGAQEFAFHAHAYVGDTVVTEAELVELGERGANEVVVVETRTRDGDGELVSEGTWTFVVRGGGDA